MAPDIVSGDAECVLAYKPLRSKVTEGEREGGAKQHGASTCREHAERSIMASIASFFLNGMCHATCTRKCQENMLRLTSQQQKTLGSLLQGDC